LVFFKLFNSFHYSGLKAIKEEKNFGKKNVFESEEAAKVGFFTDDIGVQDSI